MMGVAGGGAGEEVAVAVAVVGVGAGFLGGESTIGVWSFPDSGELDN